MQISSEAVARQLRVNRGAVIQAVAPNSAAAKAGLLPTRRALSGIVAGDTIVRIDSKPVAKPGMTYSCCAQSPDHFPLCAAGGQSDTMAVSCGYCAGDLALALDDYKVGDTVMLKVQRGAGDPQVLLSQRLPFLLNITVHELTPRCLWPSITDCPCLLGHYLLLLSLLHLLMPYT